MQRRRRHPFLLPNLPRVVKPATHRQISFFFMGLFSRELASEEREVKNGQKFSSDKVIAKKGTLFVLHISQKKNQT